MYKRATCVDGRRPATFHGTDRSAACGVTALSSTLVTPFAIMLFAKMAFATLIMTSLPFASFEVVMAIDLIFVLLSDRLERVADQLG